MKKLLFAIFAHPDDEAFGPSGTLLLEAQHGTEVHLVTLTSGQSGANPDNYDDLGAVRLKEWRAAAAIIGAASTSHLGYTDGQLCNQTLLELQDRLLTLVRSLVENEQGLYESEFLTMDDTGITGHIDHTVASRATTFIFATLRAEGLPLTRLRYFCLPRSNAPKPNINWLYMPAGRRPEEINEIIDARSVLGSIEQMVRCHHTQRHDGEAHLAAQGEQIAINHFIVTT